MQIEWDKKFELGHARIDAEHKIFLDLIKSVEQLDEADKEKILRVLSEVEKYAIFHFVSEENIMIDVQYPGYKKHKEAHGQLLDILEGKVIAFREGAVGLSDLTHFLFDWFSVHTTQVDLNLARYIHQSEADG